MKSHPRTVGPSRPCLWCVFVVASGKMCFMLTLTSLEHQCARLVILYSISGFCLVVGTCLTGPVGSEDAVGRSRVMLSFRRLKTSAVLHFSFILCAGMHFVLHDTSAWLSGRFVLSTLVRPFSIIHNGCLCSLSREFSFWSC